ncbi:MAG: hypothetical protein ACRETX_09975, partial [Steroidobacteraceae bacterium]
AQPQRRRNRADSGDWYPGCWILGSLERNPPMQAHRLARGLVALGALLSIHTSASAQLVDITAPGDPIVGVAATPGSSTSSLAVPGTLANFNNYPPAETPAMAIDDLVATKYLNFQKMNAGWIATPSTTDQPVTGIRFVTGNDSPERDPMTLVLEGTNDLNATTTLNSTWVTIYSGVSGLATDPGRNAPGAVAHVANAQSFRSYRMLVTTVRELPVIANSFQFAEVELLSSGVGTPYCAGDGSGTVCPCGNASVIGAIEGCLHSFGTGGKLRASGSASLASDTVVLNGTSMPSGPALYMQGTTQQAGGAGVAFGDGLRCIAGTVVWLGPKHNVGGASQFPAVGDPSVSMKGLVTAPGVRTYQVWYRNAASFCSSGTYNLSNGVTITWAP